MIKTVYNKLTRLKNDLFGAKYYVVYKNHDDKIKTYLIGNINLYNSFGNKTEDRDNAGFKAYNIDNKKRNS